VSGGGRNPRNPGLGKLSDLAEPRVVVRKRLFKKVREAKAGKLNLTDKRPKTEVGIIRKREIKDKGRKKCRKKRKKGEVPRIQERAHGKSAHKEAIENYQEKVSEK